MNITAVLGTDRDIMRDIQATPHIQDMVPGTVILEQSQSKSAIGRITPVGPGIT